MLSDHMWWWIMKWVEDHTLLQEFKSEVTPCKARAHSYSSSGVGVLWLRHEPAMFFRPFLFHVHTSFYHPLEDEETGPGMPAFHVAVLTDIRSLSRHTTLGSVAHCSWWGSAILPNGSSRGTVRDAWMKGVVVVCTEVTVKPVMGKKRCSPLG